MRKLYLLPKVWAEMDCGGVNLLSGFDLSLPSQGVECLVVFAIDVLEEPKAVKVKGSVVDYIP